MNGVLVQFNQLSIYLLSLILVMSFLWGAFVFYKKSAESYLDEVVILDVIVLMAFWGLVMGRLAQVALIPSVFWGNWIRILQINNYPGINYWGALLGMIVTLWITSKKYKLKFFDLYDFLSLGLVSGISWYLALSSFLKFSIIGGALAIVYGLLFFWLWKMEKDYRTFAWYRAKKNQAKSGLIGGLVLSIIGFTEILFQIGRGLNLIQLFGAVVLIVGGVILVYIRSGRTVKDDLKIFTKK